MEIEIISAENIGPACPTPHHLKIYKLSALDQIFQPFYVPLILFYLNDPNTSLNDVIFTRAKHLKQSLSETLTCFYPFAGRIKDEDLYVHCNDEGVYYAKARVHYQLSKLLGQPDDLLMNRLVPRHPDTMESTSGKYVFAIQVNIFDCGGIGISTSTSHKVIDGNTYYTFFKAWAAKAQGSSSVVIDPNFIASSLFPQNPSLLYKWPRPVVHKQAKFSTRRFLFDAAAITALKTKIASFSSNKKYPTSVEAVSALIWKCAADAALKSRSISENTPHILSIFMNLRRKKSPPLTDHSIGNVLWRPFAQCVPGSDILELHRMVDLIRRAISQINSDFVDKIRGDEGVTRISQLLKEYCELFPKVDCLNLTSICNSGIYEIDFGWGKPIWFFYVCSTPVVALADTRSGDGIEAYVTLREQDMAIFECDSDVRAFTYLNPSPLEFCKLASHARL